MTDKEFLSFKDWIGEEEYNNDEWVTVARKFDDGVNDFFTTSVLLKARAAEKQNKAIEGFEWLARLEFGNPHIESKRKSTKINYFPNDKEQIEGIKIEPFIVARQFNNDLPLGFEVIQNFILHYNLYHVKEESIYKHTNDDGEEFDVIKIIKTNNNYEVKIATKFLKEYLFVRKATLVRQHDNRRRVNKRVELESEVENDQKIDFSKDNEYFYNIVIWIERLEKDVSSSRLTGKDLIKPYKSVSIPKKQYKKFIVGKNENGQTIKKSCDYSGFGHDDEKSKYSLAPVYFRKEVLKKYYDEPNKYKIDSRYLDCFHLWGIPYDINKSNLVQVYLKDLSSLPTNEQSHWEQYNVAPDGGITEERFRSDFMTEFVEPTDEIYAFKKAHARAQECFKKLFSSDLFKVLSEDDMHCYTSLHIPLTQEVKELDEQVQNIAKVVVDSLVKDNLDKNANASIKALSNFLHTKIEEHEVEDIVLPFKMIQGLRSTGSAHLKGKNYSKIISDHELDALTNSEKFKKIVLMITQSLNSISELLSKLIEEE